MCPTGSQCKVNQTLRQAYCEASCDLDNGGCADDRLCSLQQVMCEGYPCPPAVQCLSKYSLEYQQLHITTSEEYKIQWKSYI